MRVGTTDRPTRLRPTQASRTFRPTDPLRGAPDTQSALSTSHSHAEGGGGGLPLTWACDTIFTLPSGPLGTVEAQGTVCVNRCAVLVAGVSWCRRVVSLSYQYEARCRAISQHASLQEFCCACASAHEPYGRTRAAGTSHNSQNESSAAPAPEHAGLTS